MHSLEGKAPEWGGRRAAEYKALTLQTYGTVCWLCRLPGADSADHIIPLSKGGAVFDIMNLGPAHRRCNFSRGNRPAEAYTRIEDGTAYFTNP
jgi:5-methylcytosine-specific restriction endonuclease McrA